MGRFVALAVAAAAVLALQGCGKNRDTTGAGGPPKITKDLLVGEWKGGRDNDVTGRDMRFAADGTGEFDVHISSAQFAGTILVPFAWQIDPSGETVQLTSRTSVQHSGTAELGPESALHVKFAKHDCLLKRTQK
jgi:hypothetical protein